MPTRHPIAFDDFREYAPRIYRGKCYQDRETQNVYEFVAMLPDGCPTGEVQAKNITKGTEESLPLDKWFSLLSTSGSRRHSTLADKVKIMQITIPSPVGRQSISTHRKN